MKRRMTRTQKKAAGTNQQMAVIKAREPRLIASVESLGLHVGDMVNFTKHVYGVGQVVATGTVMSLEPRFGFIRVQEDDQMCQVHVYANDVIR